MLDDTAQAFFLRSRSLLHFCLHQCMHKNPRQNGSLKFRLHLRDAKLDGWLFYDFRHSDPLAYRILKLDEKMLASRRWFYYVPASGEPVKIVQSIEQFKLDSLPGRKLVFRGWQELHARLREVLAPAAKESKRRIAMQYSPMNDIPYISRVDAGTIELVRSFGVEPVSERGTGATIRSRVLAGAARNARGSVR